MHKLLSLFLFLSLSLNAFGQDFLPDRPTGMVNDFADMLTSTEEQRLESKLRSYRDTTTNAFVIATIESLQGYSIEEVATTLHNSWNIQYEQRDNGVLILISEQDREMRIEVGYGLEGAIPDIMANRIIEDVMTPSFKSGDFYGGLNQATNILIDLAAGEFEGFPKRQSSSGDEGIPIDLIILFVILIFFLISRGKSGKGGRRRSLGSNGIIFFGGGFGGGGGSFGGGGGGGFGGFGGGGGFTSGGGGASGGW